MTLSNLFSPDSSVYGAIEEAGIGAGARVLVAVSGGSDSVALAHAITRLSFRPGHEWLVRIAHVNHGLRADESELDELFVLKLGYRLGVSVEVLSVSVATYSQTHHVSIETAARELRYAALFRILDEWHGDVVLTGHNLDDQAETVVTNLIRGGGIAGLAGMPVRRGRLTRPFLAIPRSEIARYLEQHDLPHRQDLSNLDPAYRRNRIRHTIMPLLEKEHPRARMSIARAGKSLGRDLGFIERQVEEARTLVKPRRGNGTNVFELGPWRALHPSLQSHVLRAILLSVLGNLHDIHENHIERLMAILLEHQDDIEFRSQLPHRIALSIRRGTAFLSADVVPTVKSVAEAELRIPGTVAVRSGECRAEVRSDVPSWSELERELSVLGPFHALCDAAILVPTVRIRARKNGDRMQPFGLGGSRKVQDLMVDRGIPSALRDTIPVFENSQHIVWLPGVALDQRAAVCRTTVAVAHLTFVPEQGATMLESLGHFGPSRS